MSAQHDTWFGRLLHLYPRSFREAYGARMKSAFAADMHRERQRRRPFGLWRLWLRVLADTLVGALMARREIRAGRPVLSRPDASQIGYFRPNGSVETASTRVANNVALLSEMVVLNYMALHNDVARFGTVLPGNGLGNAASMDALTAFAPIR